MKTPFLGCAYYPEDWDESFIADDIQKMKLAGIKCARIGEFAWRRMEPVRGQYEFEWLHKVLTRFMTRVFPLSWARLPLRRPSGCPRNTETFWF